MSNNTNPIPTGKMEVIALSVLLTGLIFKIAHWPFAGPMIVISLGTLAAVYTIRGFEIVSYVREEDILDAIENGKFEQKEKPFTLVNIATGILLAITCIGILFRLMYWPFSQPYLSIACVGLPIAFAGLYIARSKSVLKETAKIYLFKSIRVAVFFTVAATLYFTSLKTQIDVENWDDPEMARLKYKAMSNPTNVEYKKEYLEYRKTK